MKVLALLFTFSCYAESATVSASQYPTPLVTNPYVGGDAWTDAISLIKGGRVGFGLQGSYYVSGHLGMSADLITYNNAYYLTTNIVFRIPLPHLSAQYHAALGIAHAFNGTSEKNYLATSLGIRMALDNSFDFVAEVRYTDTLEVRAGIGLKF